MGLQYIVSGACALGFQDLEGHAGMSVHLTDSRCLDGDLLCDAKVGSVFWSS